MMLGGDPARWRSSQKPASPAQRGTIAISKNVVPAAMPQLVELRLSPWTVDARKSQVNGFSPPRLSLPLSTRR